MLTISCGIHGTLPPRTFRGCMVFDCLGPGADLMGRNLSRRRLWADFRESDLAGAARGSLQTVVPPDLSRPSHQRDG